MRLAQRRRALMCGKDYIIKGKLGATIEYILYKNGTLHITGTGKTYSYHNDGRPYLDYLPMITDVLIDEGITSLGEKLFISCVNLNSVVMPDTITEIMTSVFSGCSNLGFTHLSSSLTSIGAYAFYSCTNFDTDEIPESVTTIGISAFYGNKALSITKLPSKVTSYNQTFQGSTNVKTENIPEGVTAIGRSSFESTGIINLELPSTLLTLDARAFSGCSYLTSVRFNSTPTISNTAFNYVKQAFDIYVPWSEGEVDYAPWGATNATIHYNSQI